MAAPPRVTRSCGPRGAHPGEHAAGTSRAAAERGRRRKADEQPQLHHYRGQPGTGSAPQDDAERAPGVLVLRGLEPLLPPERAAREGSLLLRRGDLVKASPDLRRGPQEGPRGQDSRSAQAGSLGRRHREVALQGQDRHLYFIHYFEYTQARWR